MTKKNKGKHVRPNEVKIINIIFEIKTNATEIINNRKYYLITKINF